MKIPPLAHCLLNAVLLHVVVVRSFLPRIVLRRAIPRLATLSLAAGIGLTAAPTRAADATLVRDTAVSPPSGAEDWALRPTRVTPAAALLQRVQKAVPLTDLPAERRQVRIVYQGYSDARPITVPLSASR